MVIKRGFLIALAFLYLMQLGIISLAGSLKVTPQYEQVQLTNFWDEWTYKDVQKGEVTDSKGGNKSPILEPVLDKIIKHQEVYFSNVSKGVNLVEGAGYSFFDGELSIKCSIQKDGSAVCDSALDGNADGKCTPGVSCCIIADSSFGCNGYKADGLRKALTFAGVK